MAHGPSAFLFHASFFLSLVQVLLALSIVVIRALFLVFCSFPRFPLDLRRMFSVRLSRVDPRVYHRLNSFRLLDTHLDDFVVHSLMEWRCIDTTRSLDPFPLEFIIDLPR